MSTNGDEEGIDEAAPSASDPIYEKLKNLPFFVDATKDQQRKLYLEMHTAEAAKERDERDAQMKREEREAQLTREREERQFQLQMKQLDAEVSEKRAREESPASDVISSACNVKSSGFGKVPLPIWEEKTRLDAYLNTCERLLEGAEVEKRLWPAAIVPKLPEKARAIYNSLPRSSANNYEELKEALLKRFSVSAAVYRKNFFAWTKRNYQTYTEYIHSLREQLTQWVQSAVPRGESVNWEELLLRYRLDTQAPDELRLLMLDLKIQNIDEACRLADEFASSRPAPQKSQSAVPAAQAKQEPQRAGKFCEYCQKPGHDRVSCFADPNSPKFRPRNNSSRAPKPNSAPPSAPRSQTTLCAEPRSDHAAIHPLFEAYTGAARVQHSSREVMYLRDTGSTLCFLDRSVVPEASPPILTGETITVTGISNIPGTYPLAEVHIDCDLHCGPATVALVDRPPLQGVSLLIGNDLSAKSNDLNYPCCVVTRSRAKLEAQSDLCADLSPDDMPHLFNDDDDEDHDHDDDDDDDDDDAVDDSNIEQSVETNELPEVSLSESIVEEPNLDPLQLTTTELLRLQEADQGLAQSWELAGEESDEPGYYANADNGLLMYQERPPQASVTPDWRRQPQIVVPKPLRSKLLRWAHDDPASGHLGYKKTLIRLKKNFTWPGIRKDVERYCQSCGPCQRLGGGAQAVCQPLSHLPIVGKPFEMISADIVGPLKATSRGNRYILVVIDHATRYLEAKSIPIADAHHIIEFMVELMSRHGLPRQILTDRGSVFTSEAFSQFLKRHQIEQLLTCSYRPESNGVVEKANGTLKRMIKACLEGHQGQDWDDVLPWVLFAYRSAEHSSTGVSPFLLLYGREPLSMLDIVSLTWLGEISAPVEEVPASEYIAELQSRLADSMREANKRDLELKEGGESAYNKRRRAKETSFKKGDSVLIHLPTRGKPLTGEWQGPYLVAERVGRQTYIVNTPDKRVKVRHLHANALRRWRQRPDETAVAAVALSEGQTVGDIMDAPDIPPELESRFNPGNYHLDECIPSGDMPSTEHLTPEQENEVLALCQQFEQLFSGQLGRIRNVAHDIDVGDHGPIRQHFYRCSPDRMQIIKREIDEMLRQGVIQPSKSEWSSPLLLVRQNEKWRPCVDYRRVNAITKGESYPLPRLDDLIDQVGNSNFVTTLDLAKGYWQVPLTPRAREIAAFSTPFGHYECITMPFGLKSAPMTFQRAMNAILSGVGDFACAYLDDISVRSDTWHEHLYHLAKVFELLAEAGVTLNAAKCVIGAATVRYLGHEVGGGQVAPADAKITAVQNIPEPQTRKELRSFLGVVGFYRRFIPHFADIAAPLTDLLRGNKKAGPLLTWDAKCTAAFCELKTALAKRPILKAPDFCEPFAIYTDASEIGIAAVLTQIEDQAVKPVAYYSRKLLDREKRYCTTEKELLAILASLEQFHAYVGYGPVAVHSDHEPLTWLRRCSSPNQRILRWALTLAQYEIQVQHIRGSDNVMADMLSRQFRD